MQNPFENTSIPMPGYNREGERIWPAMELTPDNLSMLIHWRRTTPEEVSAQCDGLSSSYIRKLMTDARKNPGKNVMRQLSTALQVIFIIL